MNEQTNEEVVHKTLFVLNNFISKLLDGNIVRDGFAWVFTFLAPINYLVSAVVIFTFIDMVTGIWKSVHKEGWKSIRANKLGITVRKTILYPVAIIMAFLMEILFVPDLPLTKISAGFVCTVELKSIYENIQTLTGLNFWQYIIEIIQNRLKNGSK